MLHGEGRDHRGCRAIGSVPGLFRDTVDDDQRDTKGCTRMRGWEAGGREKSQDESKRRAQARQNVFQSIPVARQGSLRGLGDMALTLSGDTSIQCPAANKATPRQVSG